VNLRIRALERRKLPEELDQLSGLARPWTWLGVGALALAVAALVAWSFAGRIPRTIDGSGVIAIPGGLSAVDSNIDGTVRQVLVGPDQFVGAGEGIVVIGHQGNLRTVKAPYAGQIVQLDVLPGEVIPFATPLFTIQQASASPQGKSVYLFIPTTDGGALAPGMTVNVTVSTVPSSAFGVLHGKIASVSASPLSTAAVSALVGNPDLAEVLTKQGPPLLAQVKLETNSKTESGFSWSTPKGPPFSLQAGTPVTAQVVQSQQRPIDVIFGT